MNTFCRTILVTGLATGLLAGSAAAGSMHTSPVSLSQPDAHGLACYMANVSNVPIFGIRIEIREISGNVIESHQQDVLLPQETAKPLFANTIDPFVPTPTLRCSFHFRAENFRVRASGCVVAEVSDAFGSVCRANLLAY